VSSIFKGVRKIFKKVFKVVKKVALVAIAVAAIVFTGGAALGLAGVMGGGWAAAAATVGTTIGGSGLLGTVLTGAITQAGTGALIGGAISAATGGSISKGMLRGAAAGAVTGGVMGGVGHVRNASGVEGYGPITEGSVTTTPLPETAGVNYGAGTGQAVDAAGNVIPAATQGKGLLRGVGSFIKDNPEIAGGIITGIGQGLLSGSEADAEKDLLRERYRLTAANYEGSDPGATYRGFAPGTSGVSPTERFDSRNYGSWSYEYDPKQGKIVKVPAGQGQ